MTTASKFWGLVVEPGKKYAQIVPEAFKLSMASLGSEADLAQATSTSAKHSGRTSVIFETAEGNTFCLCSLTPGKIDQQPLDLVYEANEQVAFLVDGPHAVHLTGFVLDEPESEFDEEDMSEEDMSEEDMSEEDMAECDDSECDSQHDDEEFDSEEFDSEELDSDEFDSEDSEGEPRITVVDSEEEEKSSVKRVAAETQAQNAAKKIKAEAVSTPKAEVKKVEEKKPSTPQQQQKKNEAASPAAQKPAAPQQKPVTPQQKPAQEALMNKVLSNGLRIQDLKVGNGATASNGKTVWVHYKGLLSNGKQFDSSIGGQPLRFKLGAGQVVKGFDMGVEGMKIGSSRRIVIPPQLGYGKQRSGPIPPNSTLIFELELVKMQ